MKAHLITTLVIDFEKYGRKAYEDRIEQKECGDIVSGETFDIGEWDDDHPLNKISTDRLAYLKGRAMLFAPSDKYEV